LCRRNECFVQGADRIDIESNPSHVGFANLHAHPSEIHMKVLIVEDDAMQRMVLADLMRGFAGVEIVEAADGASAWKELQDGLSPVLCCCDMRMPGMSGIELLQRFKSCSPFADVPFVFITAAADRDTIKKAIEGGATNYILKPINLAEARSRLATLFQGICARYSEDPRTTRTRMGMPPLRLLDYFDAFKQEIVDARPTLAQLLANGEHTPAIAKLDALKTGCIALGLWHASGMIEHVRALEPDLVDRILKDIESMGEEQMLRVEVAFGLQGSHRLKVVQKLAQPVVAT
jgi:two-component system chemotaxis response regulator CheY